MHDIDDEGPAARETFLAAPKTSGSACTTWPPKLAVVVLGMPAAVRGLGAGGVDGDAGGDVDNTVSGVEAEQERGFAASGDVGAVHALPGRGLDPGAVLNDGGEFRSGCEGLEVADDEIRAWREEAWGASHPVRSRTSWAAGPMTYRHWVIGGCDPTPACWWRCVGVLRRR